jgi:hypothetical protein
MPRMFTAADTIAEAAEAAEAADVEVDTDADAEAIVLVPNALNALNAPNASNAAAAAVAPVRVRTARVAAGNIIAGSWPGSTSPSLRAGRRTLDAGPPCMRAACRGRAERRALDCYVRVRATIGSAREEVRLGFSRAVARCTAVSEPGGTERRAEGSFDWRLRRRLRRRPNPRPRAATAAASTAAEGKREGANELGREGGSERERESVCE